jgi:rod shape-determining protein MreC
LLLCLLLSVAAIALPDRWSQSVATGLRNTILAPLLWVQRQAAEGRTSRSRFLAVQAERDSVALASQSVAALTAENSRLRALLELRARTKSTSVPAEVLHQTLPTEGRTLLLGVGARSGIRPGDPVVSPEGLLGVLVSVGVNTSVAMTWAHPDFRVSAVTEDGSALGIVAPSSTAEASEAFLEFRGVA